MTIGPLPMIRMEARSVRRGTSATPGHDRGELIEQVGRVMRTGTGLGMVLDREHRLAPEPQTLAHTVVEVDVGDLDVTAERVGIDRVVVVLARDLDPTRRNM